MMEIGKKIKLSLAGLFTALILGCMSMVVGCSEEPKDYYGPATYYGPAPPCESDQECVDEYGEGWYCDDSLDWPICREE